MVSNLALLALLTGNQAYQQRGEAIARAFASDVSQNLAAHTGLLAASMDLLSPQLVVIATGDGKDAGSELLKQLYAVSMPGAAELTVTPRQTRPPSQPKTASRLSTVSQPLTSASARSVPLPVTYAGASGTK